MEDWKKKIEESIDNGEVLTLLARVQALLDIKGMSKAQLAGRLRVSLPYLDGILEEKICAPVRFKIMLARELGVNPSEIWPERGDDDDSDS